jgi:iron complex outermembrane recepter protein
MITALIVTIAFFARAPAAVGGTDGAAESADAEALPELQEVVITAEHRSEKIQDVPLAVSAISSDELERYRIATAADLARDVPSLNFTELSPGEVRFSMRGIASQTGLGSVVGYYLDDVAFENRSGLWSGVSNIDYFDLDRIEVLRGPQGTLFGAGAMGGAIRLITAQPDPTQVEFKTEADAATIDGGEANYSGKFAYNQPLASDLALRVVVTEDRSGGFIDGATTDNYANLSVNDPIFAHNENDTAITTARAALRWTPLDSLTITPSFLYRHSTADGFDYFQATPGPPYVYHHVFTDKNYSGLSVGTLDIQQKIGSATLTSVTAYQRKTWNGVDDYSLSAANLYQAFTGSSTALAIPLYNLYRLDYREFSQELRLTSAGEGALKWIVGARYMHFVDEPGGQSLSNPELGSIISSVIGVPPQSLLVYEENEADWGDEAAVFGEASYAISHRLDATLGLRVYRLRFVNEDGTLVGLLASGDVPRTSAAKNGNNPKLDINYHLTDDVMAYVSGTKGYRPGGPNEALLSNAGAPCQYGQAYRSVYDPDSVWTYELGEKSTLFNRVLTLNTAIYRTDWTGIQGSITSNCGGFIANFGNARIKGAELEASIRPVTHLSFTASASYNDARFVSVNEVLASAVSVSPGARVATIPKTQLSVGGEWSMPLNAAVTGYLRADAEYVGSAPMSYTETSSEFTRPSYTTINASIGEYWRELEASVYVTNLANRLQIVDINTPSSGPALLIAAPPRTVGINLRYHFH